MRMLKQSMLCPLLTINVCGDCLAWDLHDEVELKGVEYLLVSRTYTLGEVKKPLILQERRYKRDAKEQGSK